ATFAEPCELTINLLVVGFPEESDGRIERLGEFIARHRTFRQAHKDCVTERQCSNPPFLTDAPCILDIMHKGAYASICISGGWFSRTAISRNRCALHAQETSDDHDRP